MMITIIINYYDDDDDDHVSVASKHLPSLSGHCAPSASWLAGPC